MQHNERKSKYGLYIRLILHTTCFDHRFDFPWKSHGSKVACWEKLLVSRCRKCKAQSMFTNQWISTSMWKCKTLYTFPCTFCVKTLFALWTQLPLWPFKRTKNTNIRILQVFLYFWKTSPPEFIAFTLHQKLSGLSTSPQTIYVPQGQTFTKKGP
jgi:hypothetical protein